jgi:hypothetical protein
MGAGVLYVALEQFNFVSALAQLSLLVSDSSFEISGEMRLNLLTSALKLTAVILGDQIVYDLIFPSQFSLHHLQAGSQLCILISQVVSSDSLFHNVIIEALSLLENHTRAKLNDILLNGCVFSATYSLWRHGR